MRLVDHDGEVAPAMLVADLVEDERELLHCGDDDLLPGLDEPPQIARVFGVSHGSADLGELLDVVPDLLVQDRPVGHDDDGVEDRLPVLLQADQLVREPRDGVRLAAAGRVLDQVTLARTPGPASASSFRTTSSWW